MAFSVQDFNDLVRLLEERPDWRAELRRLVLTDDLLRLPAAVRELADAQQRTEQRLERLELAIISLTEAQQRTEQRLEALAEAQQRTEQRLEALAEAQQRTEQRLEALAEAQQRTEQRLEALAEAQQRTEHRLERLELAIISLTEAQQRTEQRLEALAEAQQRTEQRLERLELAQDKMAGQLGHLRGDALETRYREHAGGYFGRLLRRARVVRAEELDDLIDHGLTTGALDEETAHDLRLADLIVRGRRPGEQEETYLVVEVSSGLDHDDVLRAARRAAVLRRLRPTLAVVAGDGLTPEAADVAGAAGVWQVLDGRAEAPRSGA